MMNDRRTDDRPGAGQTNGRARPPGPEEKQGATATSGKSPGDDQRRSWRTMLRLPRFWVMLLVLFMLNWLIVPILFPPVNDRVTVPYTFFKQQVEAGNVAEITSQGEAIQGLFKQPVPDPAPVEGQTAQDYTK